MISHLLVSGGLPYVAHKVDLLIVFVTNYASGVQDESNHQVAQMSDNLNANPADSAELDSSLSFSQKFVGVIEAFCNLFFYLFAFLIIILPPLVWLRDFFGSSDSPWMVILAAIFFVFVLPAVAPLLADSSMSVLEKIRKGKFLAVFFRPLRAICAVVSIFGVLQLEYITIHSDSGKGLFEVYLELIKSL